MADYKGIKGGKVQNFSTNPPAPIVGQVWYNETTRTLNYFASNPVGSFATGGNLNTARNNVGGAGTQTASLAFGGAAPPNVDITEKYNGTAWTEVGDMNTARSKIMGSGFGLQTAAIACGGATDDYSALSETFNGTSWTETNDLNSAREQMGSVSGTTTAGLVFGGQGPPPAMQVSCENYNGTSWSEVGNLNTGRYLLAGSGVVTAGLAFGGDTDPGKQDITESWNGTAWTEVADLNTARASLQGFGVATASLAVGGNTPPISALNEIYNGTCWAEGADLSTARSALGSGRSGTTTVGVVFGGGAPSLTAATEEWSQPVTLTRSADTD